MFKTRVDTHTKKHQKTRLMNKQGLMKKNLSLAQGAEEYAVANKALGNGQFSIKLYHDSTEGIAQLRGKMLAGKKNNYVESGDVLKVLYVETNTNNIKFYQIEAKYTKNEVDQLKELGYLKFTDNTNTKETKKDVFIIGTENKDEDDQEINDIFIMGI